MKSMKILFFCLFFLLLNAAAYSADDYTILYLSGDSIADDSGNWDVDEQNDVIVDTDGLIGNCLNFRESNAYLEFPDSSGLDFDTDDFTIETYVYLTGTNDRTVLFGDRGDYNGSSSSEVTLYFENDMINLLVLDSGGNVTHSGPVSRNKWTHIAVTRHGDNFSLFIDGNLIGTGTADATIKTVANIEIEGKIDEYRVSKGIAKWTQSFTPPLLPVDIEFSADPQSILFEEAATLTWSVTNANSVSISPDIGSVQKTGSQEVTLTGSKTYTLTAVGYTGSKVIKQVIIYVDNGFSNDGNFTVDGNLGVGVLDPDEALEVNGTIKAREIIVTSTGWADHVFEPDYALAPLSDVKNHISRHKHLPGIPSAMELNKRGIPVSEILTLQMKKIEELTLYILELENRIKKLE